MLKFVVILALLSPLAAVAEPKDIDLDSPSSPQLSDLVTPKIHGDAIATLIDLGDD